MALKPENPVVGGTVLRRAAIQSPNYVTGVSGWTINQDGSAEFNNLTIRGSFQGTEFIINKNGTFFYSPSEAAGNLVASIAPAAGVDSFGNNFLAGHASYGASFAVALNAAGFVGFYTGSLAGGWTAVSEVAGDSAGNLQVNAGGQLQLIGTSGVTIQGSANVGNPSPNSTSMNGLSSPGIVGTSGAASAGTAHTHSAGSYTVGSGQHVHDLQNHAHPL